MYRVTLTISSENDEGVDVATGDIVGNFEEYLTSVSDTWYRLIRIQDAKREEAKQENL